MRGSIVFGEMICPIVDIGLVDGEILFTAVLPENRRLGVHVGARIHDRTGGVVAVLPLYTFGIDEEDEPGTKVEVALELSKVRVG